MLNICDVSNPPEVENPYSFPLDAFQKHAVRAINNHEIVLVTAKTGSGKTLVGEYQMKVSLAKKKRVFYTTPIKSLTNQKFHDFKKEGINTGILTGDIKHNGNADVVVMTTEILCNFLYKKDASLSLDNVDAVIFDEVHYFNNPERGKVWEECLILLPPEINLVLLSATIDGADKFGQWLVDIKQKPVNVISTQYRIVPLVHKVEDEVLMDAKDVFYPDAYRRWLKSLEAQKKKAKEHRQQVANRRRGGYEDPVVEKEERQHSFTYRLNELIRSLEKQEKLPAIFFIFSRKNCEYYAKKIEDTLLDSSDIASVRHIVKFHLHRYPAIETSPQFHTLMGRLEKGVAFHHSGLLPVLKEIVEILFVRGFIKLLFATETFSVGLNMPAKTVIMTSLRKNDEYGIRMLRRDEYTQMAGRAGRRGKDTSGLVVYIPDRDPESLEDVKTMMTQGTQELHSKMLFNYEFLLRCIYGHKLGWMSLVKKSYWFVEHNRRLNGLERELADVQKRIKSLHIDDFMLSHFDERDELERHFKRAVNAEKKMAQRNLESWKNKHVGPRWDAGWMAYNERLSLENELTQLQASIERHENFYQDIEPLERWLETQGFVHTLLGTLASNIHVGHPILMARAFHDKVFHTLEIPQLLGCLAMFVDSQRVEFVKPTECRHLTKDAEDCIYTVLGMAETYKATDPSNDDPWTLTAYWVDPVIRWANNENYLAICTEYDLYEGDFVKSMLTMGKIVEEWIKLATLVNETETLERLANLHSYIIKGVVVPDSLYVSL